VPVAARAGRSPSTSCSRRWSGSLSSAASNRAIRPSWASGPERATPTTRPPPPRRAPSPTATRCSSTCGARPPATTPTPTSPGWRTRGRRARSSTARSAPCCGRATPGWSSCGSVSPAARPCRAMRWTRTCGPCSSRPATVPTSSTAPATASASPPSTATGPTSTRSRRSRSAPCCRASAPRSSPASTSRTSASAARSTSTPARAAWRSRPPSSARSRSSEGSDMSGRTIRAATDVGGTFTDLVCLVVEEDGRQVVRTAKVDTTPPDFDRGVMDVLRKAGLDLAGIDFLAHGTTVVINALTERKGVKTGLITTEGFRDSLEIARGNRPDFFNLHYQKPKPFVPRYLRREVPGRLSPQGTERQPLDLSGLPGIVEDFKAEGVEAIGICLLHSYADPVHEVAVLERVRELWPEVSVVASHQIVREWREYERTSTTVLSAYVQPLAERYLTRLEESLAGEGFAGQ